MAVPALRHAETKFLSPLWSVYLPTLTDGSIFTVLFSMVDSTVGVLPITKVNKSLDTLPTDFLRDSTGSKILEGRTYGSAPKWEGAYDAEEMDALPVGVQVVGKPWEEEKVLGMMRILEGLVGYDQ
jgi:hypothetical protein